MRIENQALFPCVLALCMVGCSAGLKSSVPSHEEGSVLVIQEPYRDCEEVQGRLPQEFSAMDQAVDWLTRHRDGVLAGSLVVIAGVAFVVAFPPGALMVLVPVVALTSSEVTGASRLATVTP